MTYNCDMCGQKMKWGEVYICYLSNKGTRINFCMPCSEEHPDEKKREGVKWGVCENGLSDFEFIPNQK